MNRRTRAPACERTFACKAMRSVDLNGSVRPRPPPLTQIGTIMPNTLTPVLAAFEVGTTVDEAWTLPNADTMTNNHLRDGDLVELEADTKGDFNGRSFVVPRGTLGTVTECKAQRPERASGESSHFFAVAEVLVEGCTGRIQVPHAALRVITQPLARPDAIRRNQ